MMLVVQEPEQEGETLGRGSSGGPSWVQALLLCVTWWIWMVRDYNVSGGL